MFKARVVLASIGPNDIPIYSVEATYPRFIHAEIMTHRDRNRNAASSRAIPWKRHKRKAEQAIVEDEYNRGILSQEAFLDALVDNCMYKMVMTDPVVPMYMGLEQPGMQSGDELVGDARIEAEKIILEMRNYCVAGVERLARLGLHKSICNRYVEPWMWITVLMTSTNWKNFFRLRHHPAAEKHFQHIAAMIKEEIDKCTPRPLAEGQWHLPYVTKMDDPTALWCGQEGEEILERHKDVGYLEGINLLKRISAGRSARLSYLTHEGKRDWQEDINLCKKLIERDDDVLHATPLENVAQASASKELRSGPYRGWFQFRKEFANEFIEG